ncbi:legumain-like [Cyprinus carpio]|uniref:Legumain-like n=1 Tax=Cyprinus carpio TaxID=7962 RepID=A0A9Q9YCQ7_CYPCA|nr:legumain-like [Cyprinus carpio]
MTHVQIKGSSYFFHFNCHQLKYGKYCIIINRPSHQHRFSTHESDMNGRKCLYKDRDHPIKSTRNQLDNHRRTPDTHHRLCFEKAKKMSGKKWVLLVAGSKNWENYQHQANVWSLYQIIRKHGIPDEQIVVMMYDDIANNPENPTKGTIVSVADDTDVYSGVPKDYTGKDVTPQNFLAALQGDESTNKKVIKSGAEDNIYIYMTGLGTEGTFEFPEESVSIKNKD